MLMDERKGGGGDLYVFAGVIVRTTELPAIRKELRAEALRFAGNRDEHLKYVPDAGSAQARYCAARGIRSGEAKAAVLAALARRPRSDATIVAGVVADPRGKHSGITEAGVYSWSFEMTLQRYAKGLEGRADRRDGTTNEVMVDTIPAEAHRFHELYAASWNRAGRICGTRFRRSSGSIAARCCSRLWPATLRPSGSRIMSPAPLRTGFGLSCKLTRQLRTVGGGRAGGPTAPQGCWLRRSSRICGQAGAATRSAAGRRTT